MRALDEDLRDAARSDAKVLITGESGVGKELAARTIHAFSARSSGPLVTLNSAGVPDTLLESELFGHVRGSFTGAYRDRPGLFELASGGTVLLDEIGEMSLRMQSLLLRFLETGEIQPVGSDRPVTRVDVRVIAMTNRRLLEQIEAKVFREDLYYRLNVIHVIVPPLRDRREDIPLLAEKFLRSSLQEYGIEPPIITPEAMECLLEYRWPGNVRELKNVIERCVVRNRNRQITPEDLPRELLAAPIVVTKKDAEPLLQGTRAETTFNRLITGNESFWTIVYAPFIARDLTRDDLRRIVTLGLERSKGNFRLLLRLFKMEASDYKRFLHFLRKYQCQAPLHSFRMIRTSKVDADTDEPTDPLLYASRT